MNTDSRACIRIRTSLHPFSFKLLLIIHLIDRIGDCLEYANKPHEVWWKEEEVAKAGTADNA